MHLHYFAYGSNMLRERLVARTPSAVSLGRAVLPGHALRWHKAGADGSGKCDIVPVDAPGAPPAHVQGVLYRLAAVEKPLLDQAEALGVGYTLRWFTVEAAPGPVEAFAYVALGVDPAVQPYDWYQALVVAGARQHGLSDDYVQALKAVPARTDPDTARRQRHLDLLPGGV